MSAFVNLPAVEPHLIWDGVVARVVEGEQSTFAVIELEPGAVVPEHRHSNEQVGVLATGSMTFRIGDETRELGAGDAWNIPGGTPHEVTAGPQGAIAVEAFAPARADWAALERGPATAPAWPS
jgi:quercetin dioxygenase-like cupin family protein